MTRGITAAITIAIIAILMLVTIVVAHTPSASLTCEGGLTVHLVKYDNHRHTNTVTITLDGTFLTQDTFGISYDLEGYHDLDPYVGHTAQVDVQAWDDPQGRKGYTVSYDLSLGPCAQATPSPTSTPTPVPSPTQCADCVPTQQKPSDPPAVHTPRPTLPPTDTE